MLDQGERSSCVDDGGIVLAARTSSMNGSDTSTTTTTTTTATATSSSSSSSSKPTSSTSGHPSQFNDGQNHARSINTSTAVVGSNSPSTASASSYQIAPSSTRPRHLRSLVPRLLGPSTQNTAPPHPLLHEVASGFASREGHPLDSRIKAQESKQSSPQLFPHLEPVVHHPSRLAHPSLNNPSLLSSNPGSPSWCRHLPNSRSLTTMTGAVKRSLSTPNVQQAAAAMAEGAGIPYSTDKRRNKLGYHRTSVACGHCRRRKIRCLLAKDDMQGRCANCIRLKKECNFYPVETGDRRPRSMSKPDISCQDTGSSTSSPSPGLSGNHADGASGYPSSVPVTPTFDYTGMNTEDNIRHNSGSSTNGRFSVPHSTSVSRRPSLVQMHILPSTMKNERNYLSPGDGLQRSTWELASQTEHSLSDAMRVEDPSTAFWRLNTSPMANPAFVPSQPNIGGFQSFSSVDSSELHDEKAWNSQAPSRMGSIDHGMGSGYPYDHSYASDPDFNVPPELCSASTSTASLTTSLPESSQYTGNNQPDQFFMTPYSGQLNNYNMPATMKQELGSHSPLILNDGRYVPASDDSAYYHNSPVRLSHG